MAHGVMCKKTEMCSTTHDIAECWPVLLPDHQAPNYTDRERERQLTQNDNICTSTISHCYQIKYI